MTRKELEAFLPNFSKYDEARWRAWFKVMDDFSYPWGPPRILEVDQSLCTICQHLKREKPPTGICTAFGDEVIPRQVWYIHHRAPVQGDNGIIFEPLLDWAHYEDPDYLVQIFNDVYKEINKRRND